MYHGSAIESRQVVFFVTMSFGALGAAYLRRLTCLNSLCVHDSLGIYRSSILVFLWKGTWREVQINVSENIGNAGSGVESWSVMLRKSIGEERGYLALGSRSKACHM